MIIIYKYNTLTLTLVSLLLHCDFMRYVLRIGSPDVFARYRVTNVSLLNH
jgi:hypothetical protein